MRHVAVVVARQRDSYALQESRHAVRFKLVNDIMRST